MVQGALEVSGGGRKMGERSRRFKRGKEGEGRSGGVETSWTGLRGVLLVLYELACTKRVCGR